ncbi:DUF58 domain-containing protein [Phycicoccus sp.]|uniref:DUF58 domain-containing protein n=1 Tax=Phycicoccus sp. TaxID=1902410 RepID=UPI002D1905A7|nr:DUF58 domain-containing protein [Phycicoccus sp.]HMM94892.1 DUF58 domain-containing protein [Phycicoccus sp.]
MSDPTGLPEDTESTVRRSDLTPAPARRTGDAAARPVDGDGATTSRAALRENESGGARPRGRGAGRATGRGSDRPARRRKGPRLALPRLRTTGPGRTDAPEGRAARPSSRTRSRADGSTRTITLPRVQVPSALTDTGARILVLTGERIRPLAEQTRRVWHPVVEVVRWVSPLGWTVLGVGLLSWWLTARYTWPELAMVAAACLVLVLACLLLALDRAKVRIRADVEPARVTVGDPATGRIAVTNTSKRGMLPLLVELPVGRTAARFTLPALASQRTHEELFVVPTHQRGVVPVGPATTVHGDPLGLVRRTVQWTERTELYVHPRTISLDSLGAGLLRDLEGEVTPDLSMSDLAFHALREYQAGDDRRYVHWRSSAKHGRLLVRQFLDTRRSHLALVVDTTPDVYTNGEDDVELGISCAASLAVRSILDEQDTTVVCHGQTASRTTAPLTLDALSRAEVGPLDLYGSVGEAAALAPDASIAVLVTGVERAFIQVQRTLDQFEPEVVKVALVVDPDVPVGIRRLGSIVILHVRELTDLRRVLFSGALA